MNFLCLILERPFYPHDLSCARREETGFYIGLGLLRYFEIAAPFAKPLFAGFEENSRQDVEKGDFLG